MKFDIAVLYIKVPSGSNRLFLCPLDVLKNTVLLSTCLLYTRLRVELRGVCVFVW